MKSFDGMSDVEMLARIMDAEAGQEGVTGKAAVGAVIQNRVKSGSYGDGVRGVITKPGQFSAINDVTGYAGGKGANQIFWREPSEESRHVAQAILAGNYEDITNGATHYFNPKSANPKWARGKNFRPIGNHVFGNADAGRVSGGNGSDTVAGGQGGDRLHAIQSEIARRKGQPGGDRLQAVQAEIARRKGQQAPEMLPDPRDRQDVEAALGQLAQQSTLEPKGITEGLFDEFTSGIVGNFGDNLEALEGALPALLNDDNFMEQYQIKLSEERERAGDFQEENPVLATGANIAGAVATGVGAAKKGLTLLGAGGASVPKAIGAGALEGGVYGTIWGAGASDGNTDQLIDDAIEGGALGVVLGGVVSGAVQRIANGASRRAAVKALKPTADLQAAKTQAYKAADQLGAVYGAGAVDNMINRLGHQLRSRAFNPELHKGTAAAMEYANSLKGKALTLTELDQLRQIVARDSGGSAVPADKNFASAMINEIDDFVENTLPKSTRQGAPRRAAAQAIREARKANAVFKKTELIDTLLIEAADQAGATGSGGNLNNAIRQKFKSLLKNKKQIKYFSQEERGAMRRIVRGSSGDNLLRLVGKLAPGGNGLMTALSLGAASVNPAALGVSAAATGAKSLAERGTNKAVQGLQTTVQTGVNSVNARAPVAPGIRALFRTLADELGYEIILEESGRPKLQAR